MRVLHEPASPCTGHRSTDTRPNATSIACSTSRRRRAGSPTASSSVGLPDGLGDGREPVDTDADEPDRQSAEVDPGDELAGREVELAADVGRRRQRPGPGQGAEVRRAHRHASRCGSPALGPQPRRAPVREVACSGLDDGRGRRHRRRRSSLGADRPLSAGRRRPDVGLAPTRGRRGAHRRPGRRRAAPWRRRCPPARRRCGCPQRSSASLGPCTDAPQRTDRQRRAGSRRWRARGIEQHAVGLRETGRELGDDLGGPDADRARDPELLAHPPPDRAPRSRGRTEASPRAGHVQERLVDAHLLHERA